MQVDEAFDIYSGVVDGSIDKEKTHAGRPDEWWTQMVAWMKSVQYPWELVIKINDRVNWNKKYQEDQVLQIKGKCCGYRDQKTEGHPTGIKTILVDFTSEGAEGFCCEKGKFEQDDLEVIPSEDQVRGRFDGRLCFPLKLCARTHYMYAFGACDMFRPWLHRLPLLLLMPSVSDPIPQLILSTHPLNLIPRSHAQP